MTAAHARRGDASREQAACRTRSRLVPSSATLNTADRCAASAALPLRRAVVRHGAVQRLRGELRERHLNDQAATGSRECGASRRVPGCDRAHDRQAEAVVPVVDGPTDPVERLEQSIDLAGRRCPSPASASASGVAELGPGFPSRPIG
jgi:hypothetical protein